ncbi:CPBP family intramembrane glutamic endopeptidase [Kribbella italica]|uniref:Membrane protease YdiL (CAAX protease family) n=1 Tax=Kribbella italica TaxID=1540520 RepID=A0A7W9JBW6_9ACTN|nr:CPBP family intramembrane glutamic endopeptidase [Kribbella italica]MBB5839105.1 membrane protease YdiL (CAAX protease family) [Kribbella italica]
MTADASPRQSPIRQTTGAGLTALTLAVLATVGSSLAIQLVAEDVPRIALGILVTLLLCVGGALLRTRGRHRPVGDAVLALGALSVFGWASAVITSIPAVDRWLEAVPLAVAFLVVNATKLTSVAALVIIAVACGWTRDGLLFVRGRINGRTCVPGLRWPVVGPIVIVAVVALFLTAPEVLANFTGVRQVADLLLPVLPFLLAGPLVNAVSEELLYRHALITTLRPLIGAGVAVVVSSAIFGLGHVTGSPGGWTGVLFTFGYGLVSALAMLQNRGTVWNTGIHFFADLAAISALIIAAA